MVSSVLSPEKIVGRQNRNKAAAQNFISGGSLLGSSVVNSAANKIVGFQRAGIRPVTSAIDSTISTISTNINNNVGVQRAGIRPATSTINSIVSTISTNVNNNVTTLINKTLQGFSTDYQRRVQQIDDAKPIGILGKFLNVYKISLGFINFFGNRRNINKVRDNLEALKKSFTESFEVAKLIRQVIIKIVKQLSNLPVASPSGGGGLNLDVDIPGGGLKKTAPRGLNRMMGGGKGRMLALGAGALGLGALGAGAVNALADSPQEQAQAAATPEIPGDTIDRFASIVDRFANAISNLFKTQKPKPQQKSSGSAAGAKIEKPPGPPGPKITSGPGLEGLASFVAGAESGGRFDAYAGDVGKGDPKITTMTLNELKTKYSGTAVGAYQFMPDTAIGLAKKMGLDPSTTVFSPDVQKQIHMFHLNELGYSDYVSGKISKEQFGARIAQQYRALPVPGTNATYQDQYAGRNRALRTDVQFLQAIEKSKMSATGIAAPSAPILPAPSTAQARQQAAQQVAQAPVSQQMQQPFVMPIDLTGGTQQQTGGGGMGAPPPSQKNGPSVPFLPAANTDNFLVLYSRMVYNIVDG